MNIVHCTIIAVTFDLGRVTTSHSKPSANFAVNCGDVRSRTSYNYSRLKIEAHTLNCGDVRSRTSYNFIVQLRINLSHIAVTFDLGRVTTFKICV